MPYWDAKLVRWMEWDEFVLYREGKITKDELHDRARRRQSGSSDKTVQSSVTGWCD